MNTEHGGGRLSVRLGAAGGADPGGGVAMPAIRPKSWAALQRAGRQVAGMPKAKKSNTEERLSKIEKRVGECERRLTKIEGDGTETVGAAKKKAPSPRPSPKGRGSKVARREKAVVPKDPATYAEAVQRLRDEGAEVTSGAICSRWPGVARAYSRELVAAGRAVREAERSGNLEEIRAARMAERELRKQSRR